MKVGLVLEGGAMRGLFTAGVLDVFLENDIEVTDIVGVSAGTLFGVNYVSKQPKRALRYNVNYINDKRYMSLKSWIRTGNLINKDFTYYKVPFQLDVFDNKTFKNSKTNFYATVTNIENGEAEFIKITDPYKQMETLRATSALPFISEIIEIDDKKYLDGGIANSIPIDFFEKQNFDKIIVILTRPITYRKKKSTSLQFKLFYKKYPHLIEKLENRYKDYNETVERILELEKQGKVFVIRPSEDITVKRLEKDTQKLKKELSDLEYAVTMESATESPYTGQYWDSFEEGVYVDITTGEPLFSSKDKFKSRCGWPSFSKPIEKEVTRYYKDNSHLVERIEVRSRVGDAHLGHVFPDGPSELGGLRYCINSASIRFIKKEDLEKEGYKNLLKLFEK